LSLASAFRRRSSAWALGASVACSALALAPDAAAQNNKTDRVQPGNGDGVDLHLFRPAVDSKGFFSVNGADLLPHLDFSIGLVLDYGYGQMRLNPGHGADYLLKHAFQGTFQADLGLFNYVVVGVSAPVMLNGADAATGIGPTGGSYNDDDMNIQALGWVAGHIKVRILRPDESYPLGIAIVAQAGYEIGGSRNFASEPGFWYWPQLVLERRFFSNKLRLGLNGGYRGHTGQNGAFGLGTDGKPQLQQGDFKYSDLITAGFGVSVRVIPQLDLTAETYATYQLGGGAADAEKISAEALGGIKLFIDRNSFLMLGAGTGYLKGFQAADVRGTVGFIFEPSIGDRDGDGIKDDEDDCPDEPEDYDGFQDTKSDSPKGKYGCPDPDNDEDGIPDKLDRCPNDPEDKDGDHDDDGCPEGSDGDRDGDGILDSRDKCPNDPEDRDGFEDKDGCPDPDNDKDGILDADDQCPNDPEDKDGFEDQDGCPDPDNDHDGIPDVAEGSDSEGSCMNRPETVNGLDDEDGCPDQGRIVVSENDINILDKIQFKTGSAEILPESMKIVDTVADVLKKVTSITLVEIQGHADVRAHAGNLKLTTARAKAVLDALVKKGIASSRLRSMGYGDYCPIDSNKNEAAYEKNRRVEFKIVRKDGEPTGVVLGCQAATDQGITSPPP
jgi:outer membrane protein OmpA-like peptidoglycan-associated protein